MYKIFLITVFCFVCASVLAQINVDDSTAQVVAYWNKGEKQRYSVSFQKIKITGADTTSNETLTYDVDVTVSDSTASGYLTEWFYHNYTSNSKNEVVRKLSAVAENVKVIVETDELGAFKSVKNWEEVRDYTKKSIATLRNNFKSVPQVESLLQQVEGMFTTREAVESVAIQDVQQFLTFHGAKYTIGEVLEFPMQLPNMFNPSQPFDAKVSVYLDELNPEDNNFVMRTSQEVNSDQLTNTTFEYLKQVAKTMGTKEPGKEEIGQLTNITDTASRIHGTGWVIYSIQTKNVDSTLGAMSVEERIIELK